MWSVLRKIQGVEYTPPSQRVDELTAEQRFELHTRHLARFSIKPNPKPQDPSTLTEAFGAWNFGKINDSLQSHDLVVRVKAVNALLALYEATPEHIVRTLEVGITPTLISLLSAREDLAVQRPALVCLRYLASSPQGRKSLLDGGFSLNLVQASEKEDAESRQYAVEVLSSLASHKTGATSLIQLACVRRFVQLVERDLPQIKYPALTALRGLLCVDGAHKEALMANAVPILTNLIRSLSSSSFSDDESPSPLLILVQACHDLDFIAFHLDGKEAAVKAGAVAALAPLCTHADDGVREAALGAVMSISNTVSGKFACIEADLCAILMELLDRESSEPIQFNILKAIGNIAEAPKARTALQPALPLLVDFRSKFARNNETLLQFAQRATDIISWKP